MATAPARRLALLALAGCVLLLPGCGKLDRDAVGTELSKASSAASEGMLVAREVKRDRTWESFTKTRTAELHSDAQKSEEKLAGPTEGGLSTSAEQGSKLAAQVRVTLATLHEHPNDRRLAASVEERLSRLSDRLDQIEKQL